MNRLTNQEVAKLSAWATQTGAGVIETKTVADLARDASAGLGFRVTQDNVEFVVVEVLGLKVAGRVKKVNTSSEDVKTLARAVKELYRQLVGINSMPTEIDAILGIGVRDPVPVKDVVPVQEDLVTVPAKEAPGDPFE